MAIPTLPDYAGYTKTLAVEHPDCYVQTYRQTTTFGSSTPHYCRIATFDTGTLLEIDSENYLMDTQWDQFTVAFVSDFDQILWLPCSNSGVWSFDITSGIISTRIQKIPDQSTWVTAIAESPTHLWVTHAQTGGLYVFEKTGTGTVNTSSVFQDPVNGYIYYMPDLDLILVRYEDSTTWYLFDATTFSNMDASSKVFTANFNDPDTRASITRQITETRNGTTSLIYVQDDKTFATFENYIAGDNAYDDLIVGSGSVFAWWRMDEDSGTTLLDSSGNARDMTITGSYSKEDSLLVDAVGKSLKVLTTGEAYTDTIPEFGGVNATTELWINFQELSTNNASALACTIDANNYGIYHGFYYKPTTKELRFQNWDGASHLIYTKFMFKLNETYHIVCTEDELGRKIYVNGLLIIADPNSVPDISGSSKYGINNNSSAAHDPSGFTIDQLVLYNKTLSAQDVLDRYNLGATPATDRYEDLILSYNPLMYLPCTDAPNALHALDLSGNGNSASVTGAVVFDGTQSFIAGGNSDYLKSETFIDNDIQRLTFEIWLNIDPVFDNGQNAQFLPEIIEDNANEDRIVFWEVTDTKYSDIYLKNNNNALNSTNIIYNLFERGQYVHAVAVYDNINGNMKFYVNGELLSDVSFTVSQFASDLCFQSTGHVFPTNYSWKGYLKHVAVYDKLLTATQIKDNYNKGAQYTLPDPLTAYQADMIAQEPICYYPLNELTGTIAYDMMGRANATFVNGSADTMNSTGLDETSGDTSLQFNGTNQYLRVDNNQLIGRWDQFTCECLFKINTIVGTQDLISVQRGGGYVFRINGDGSISIHINTDAGWNSSSATGVIIETGKTYHLAITFDASSIDVYVNGIFIITLPSESNSAINYISYTLFTIAQNNNDISYTNGTIAHVAVFNEVLAEEDFRRRYLISQGVEITSNAYIDLVKADNPYFFLPFNDVVDQYPLDVMENVIAESFNTPISVNGINDESKSLAYNGSNAWTHVSSDQLPPTMNNITLECWAKSFGTTFNISGEIFGIRDVALIHTGGGTELYFYVYSPVGWSDLTIIVPNVDQWHHFVLTYDGSTLRAYDNGKLVNSMSVAQHNKTPTARGASVAKNADGSQFFQGDVDYPAYYNEIALTETQIQAHYREGLKNLLVEDDYYTQVMTDGALAFYRMNDQPDPIAVFDETYNYMGNAHSDPTFSGSNVTMDGIEDYIGIEDDIITGTGFCIECMAKLNNNGDFVMFTKGSDSNGGWGLNAYISQSELIVMVVIGSTYYESRYTLSEETINLGEWYHIAFAYYSGGKLHTFLNGQETSSASSATGSLRTSGVKWSFGRSTQGSTSTPTYYKGQYDDVAIYQNKIGNRSILDHYLIKNDLKGGFIDIVKELINNFWNRFDYDYDGICKSAYSQYTGTYFGGVTRQPVPLTKQSTHSAFFNASQVDQTIHYLGSIGATGGDLDVQNWNNNTLSISAWIKPDSVTGHHCIFKDGGETNGIELGIYNAEVGIFLLDGGVQTKCVVNVSNYIPVGKTSFIVATVNGVSKELNLYINGMLVQTQGGTWIQYNGNGGTSIGSCWAYYADGVTFGRGSPASQTAEDGSFLGYIDQLFVSSVVMPANDISTIWNEGYLGTNYDKVKAETFPVLHWTFEDDISVSAIDEIQNVALTNYGFCSSAIGFNGNGAWFDGVSVASGATDKVMLDTAISNIPVLNRQSNYSISLWVKIDDVVDANPTNVLVSMGYGNSRIEYKLAIANNILYFTIYDDAYDYYNTNGSETISYDVWNYVTVTVEDNSGIVVKLYLNGVEMNYSTSNIHTLVPDIDTASHLVLGCLNYYDNGKTHHQTNGTLDEVMFFNHVLTPIEVNNLYEALATEYQITGTVTKDGEPNANEVMIYNRTTAKLEDKVTSNASTGEFDLRWREYDPSQEYFVIAIDDDGVPHLDPIGHDRITKTEVT